MGQWVESLAHRPDFVISVPRSHKVAGGTSLQWLFSDLHTCAVGVTCKHTHTHIVVVVKA